VLTPWRAWRILWRKPTVFKAALGLVVLLTLLLVVNWTYQVLHKPSELLFPVSGALYKKPAETWQQYSVIFKEYSTDVITPELLAAMAQIEGSGNPVVRTYWRWAWTVRPFEVYRPASSAVGMYQITDATFAQARRYCIRQHRVVENAPRAGTAPCSFNPVYARMLPANAAEITSAYLDRSVRNSLERHRLYSVSLRHRQDLAAVIHLCGAGAGDDYVARRFRLIPGQRCGDHQVQSYLSRVDAMKHEFLALGRATLARNEAP
jgi:hypothetical protein